jgi:hypothetical protein
MNPPTNRVAIFGSLQKDVPEETAMSPSITPSQFLAPPTAPAMGLNYLNTPRLPSFGGGASLVRTYHTARFYDAPVPPWDNHTRQSIPGKTLDSEQATFGTHVRPLRRRRALRGEPPDDRDHSDCSTTAVRGVGVRRNLRRASVRFWPYQAAQRQNRDALHQHRSHNYSTIAQAGSSRQSFYDRRCSSSLSESAREVYGGIDNEHAAGPFGLRTPLVFVPLPISHNQTEVDPFNAIPPTPRNLASTAPPVPGTTPRVFAEASIQTTDKGDSPITPNASHVPNTQPTNKGNPRKRSRDEDGSEQAEGSTRPSPTRRRTGLGSGELMRPAPLRRSSGSTNM